MRSSAPRSARKVDDSPDLRIALVSHFLCTVPAGGPKALTVLGQGGACLEIYIWYRPKMPSCRAYMTSVACLVGSTTWDFRTIPCVYFGACAPLHEHNIRAVGPPAGTVHRKCEANAIRRCGDLSNLQAERGAEFRKWALRSTRREPLRIISTRTCFNTK